jgi:sulfur carrier protein
MNVTINGDRSEVGPGTTVEVLAAGLVDEQNRGIAVAVNGEVVSRADWPTHELKEDDRVEVLRAIGGGS